MMSRRIRTSMTIIYALQYSNIMCPGEVKAETENQRRRSQIYYDGRADP